MNHDEQELDLEIRNALRAVEVPIGAKENLLLQLLRESENVVNTTEASFVSIVDSDVIAHSAQQASSMVELNNGSRFALAVDRRRWRYSWVLVTSVAMIAFAAFLFWPTGSNTRLDVLMARHIERIENEPIQWQQSVELPPALRNVMSQVVQLQPLGFADITPVGSLSHIHVYAFRNQDGKQVLLIDTSKPKVRQGFGTQLTPLNSNTGGWSCAAAEVQGNLVVLAVPGNRAYLLKHLRNITVT